VFGIRFIYGRAKDDEEKAITPAVVYSNSIDEPLKGHTLVIGIWDCYVGIFWANNLQNKQEG
jgi:hypothetical protein